VFVCVAFALFTGVAQAQPSAPNLKSPIAANKAVQLTWDAVPGATSYKVYWGTTPGVTKTNAGDNNRNPKGVADTVPALTNDTKYFFVVTAVDAAGHESAPSNEVSATPTSTPASQPATQPANQPAAGPNTTPAQPTTNVGQSPDTNIQVPTMAYSELPAATYGVVAMSNGTPNGKITYDVPGVESLIQGACTSAFHSPGDFNGAFNDGETYAIINVINLKGGANAQNVASNNWYLYSKGKTFKAGFAGGWQLSDFDGATRLYGARKVLLVSILENNQTPATAGSPAIAYTLTVTKQQATNVANALQLLGLVFPQAPAAGLPTAPANYWACSAVPIAFKTSTIKIDLSYTAGGGSPYTASQTFRSEAKQRWDVSFALPVKKASALQFNSTANTVTASQINKTDLFAVADFYPYPVDLANSKFTFVPGIFAGVAMNSQPLHSLLFGGSVGLKLVQVYAGALLIKQQTLNGLSTGSPATPAQLASATTFEYKPSFSIGIKISVKGAVTAISGSKK
jgi:fibronectin type 3 domain-containing protein